MPSLPTLQQFNAPLYQPATMKLQGMGMQEQMKRTNIAQKQVDISGKRQAMEEQMFQINKRAKHVEMAKGFLPNVSQSNYGDFVKWNKENGVPDVAFKSPEEVAAMKPEQFEQYKVGLDKKAEDGLKLTGDLKMFYDLNQRMPRTEEELTSTIKRIKTASRPEPQTTVSEREILRKQGSVEKLQKMASEDPNKLYTEHSFKMNDDGTLYLHPVTNTPVELKTWTSAMGKRGQPKVAKALGEMWDDANELMTLLEDPEVAKTLKMAEGDGLWDLTRGKFKNTIQKWLQNKGISEDSKTATVIARIQRMASEERLKFMGTAVTEMEMRSALAWMPEGGDSLETMLNKTKLIQHEAKQEFVRWLNLYKNESNMGPWYKAFGIKRFPTGDNTPYENPVKTRLNNKYEGLNLE